MLVGVLVDSCGSWRVMEWLAGHVFCWGYAPRVPARSRALCAVRAHARIADADTTARLLAEAHKLTAEESPSPAAARGYAALRVPLVLLGGALLGGQNRPHLGVLALDATPRVNGNFAYVE